LDNVDTDTLRLFFALQPAPAQSAELVERAAPLVLQLQAQPVPATNLHATLCFVGAVPRVKLAGLLEATAQVRAGHATLDFDALDHWPQPKVLCATARDTPEAAPIHALAQLLAAAAVAAGLAPDIKPFRAHLTLARKVPAQRAAECQWPRELAPRLRMHCERFVLMQSQRNEAGSIYSVVDSWPLYIAG
jgi:2'-5' RNA ligase